MDTTGHQDAAFRGHRKQPPSVEVPSEVSGCSKNMDLHQTYPVGSRLVPVFPGWWRKTCCAWRPVGRTVPNKPGWGDPDGFEDGEDAGRTMKTPWS